MMRETLFCLLHTDINWKVRDGKFIKVLCLLMNKTLILRCFLAQIRKIRSLTELIIEAEETFTNSINQVKMELKLS